MPLTGIISLGETLWANYDKFNEDQRRNAVEIIAKSSIRLNSLINNILDFSKLSSLNYELNKENINLSELLHERIKIRKKLYLNGKTLNFVSDIEENIIFNCDPHYIKHTFDNLIINAISYCSEGIIKIDLHMQENNILFSIKDDGAGVLKEELQSIFGVFVVSSKTRTTAGGRGVGLALCKKVIKNYTPEKFGRKTISRGKLNLFSLCLILDELQKLATSSYKFCGVHVLSICSAPRLIDSLLFLKLCRSITIMILMSFVD
ncbi:MAG: ATP-binding protein [Rickettsia helvetica]|uniref:histidine kinase n=1 Tax=Rickettsia helvetica TaxID=35789 RepID=A0ABP0T6D6_RICHE